MKILYFERTFLFKCQNIWNICFHLINMGNKFVINKLVYVIITHFPIDSVINGKILFFYNV